MIRSRRADEFAAALEGRASRASSSDPDLVPLLNLAQQLQALPLGPAPEFRDSLRTRLLAVAAVAEPAPVRTPVDRIRGLAGWRLQRAAQVAAVGLAALVAITGVGTVSSRSVPGDRLYALKRAAESVQLDLARNDVNRGKRELQHAGTRLDEVAALAVGGAADDADAIIATLADMDEQTRRGVEVLFDESADAQSAELIAHVRDFAAEQQAELAALTDDLPSAAEPSAAASLALLARILSTTAAELAELANCAGICPELTADEERERQLECDCSPERGIVRRIPIGGTDAPAPFSTPRASARVPAPGPLATSSGAPQLPGTGAPAAPPPGPALPTPRTSPGSVATRTPGSVLLPTPRGVLPTPDGVLPTPGSVLPTPGSVLPTPVASTITDLLDDLPLPPDPVPTGILPTGPVPPLSVP